MARVEIFKFMKSLLKYSCINNAFLSNKYEKFASKLKRYNVRELEEKLYFILGNTSARIIAIVLKEDKSYRESKVVRCILKKHLKSRRPQTIHRRNILRELEILDGK